MFTPAGGGYSREVRALDWEEEADDAERMYEPVEVELEHFRFPFAGREWDSFFYTRLGLISFGKPIPSDHSLAETVRHDASDVRPLRDHADDQCVVQAGPAPATCVSPTCPIA